MFFLDVDPEIAAVRITENRSAIEMFESLEALKKVRSKALALTCFNRWIIVDANKSHVEVASELNKHIFRIKKR